MKLFILLIFVSINIYAQVGINLGTVSKEIRTDTAYPIESVKITEYEIKNITEHTAEIVYKTNLPTVTKIEYGLSQFNLPLQQMQVTPSTEHNLTIRNLKKGTKYYFKLTGARDIYDSFQTDGLAELELLQIGVTGVRHDEAAFFYRTNFTVKGEIQYFIEGEEENISGLRWEEYHTDARLNLSNLTPAKKYFYKIIMEDTYGRQIETEWEEFRTQEKNLALNKNVYGTFTEYHYDMRGDHSDTQAMLQRVVDGSTNYFDGIAQSGNLADTDQWIIIDLGNVYPVRIINTFWRVLAYPTAFRVDISNDKENWILLRDNVNAGSGFHRRADTGDPMLVAFVSGRGQEAKYVRVTVYKGSFNVKHFHWNFVQLNEVIIY